MTIESESEFIETCGTAIESLCELAEYTDDGFAELESEELIWLTLVIASFGKAVGSEDDEDNGGGGFRVTDELY